MVALVPKTARRLSDELAAAGPAPTRLVDGLAVFSLGDGPPLLLMPNPQGVVASSTSAGTLADLLVRLGYRLVTFDPPGAFASHARPARLDLAEMTNGAATALDAVGVVPPVAVVGHSQASLAALTLALDRPALVAGLVLIGAVDGGLPATRRAGGMPFGWSWRDVDFWRFAWLGTRLSLGRASLADHKRLRRLVLRRSYADPRRVPEVPLGVADRRLPAPARAGWQRAIRHVDLLPRLSQVQVPTLICAGRHDPQTPLRGNREIAAALPDASLVVFEDSGHYPFEEEPDRFAETVSHWLDERLAIRASGRPSPTRSSARGRGSSRRRC